MKMLLFFTILLSGLVAGLFYAYSCSVNNGLKNLPDVAYLKAMQSINIAIQNPLFFTSFLGLPVLLIITVFKYYHAGVNTSFFLILGAAILYVIGVVGITILFNVPLNETLAEFNMEEASPGEVSAMRLLFEKPWNAFHMIRTIASVISFALTILIALLQKI
jgi:uncharacterized membrane protein